MKIIIIFGSSRGRTKEIAYLLKEELERNLSYLSIEIRDIKYGIKGIEDYDIFFFGSSTWDRGDLQRDFYQKEKEILALNLKGKKGACFGAASILYPYYGEAIDILENMARKIGLEIILKSLLIDDFEKDPSLQIKKWSLLVLQKLDFN